MFFANPLLIVIILLSVKNFRSPKDKMSPSIISTIPYLSVLKLSIIILYLSSVLVSSLDLTPRNKDNTYIQARRTYDKQLNRANVKHPHGLRHAYAQERYKDLTGWKCPACGGATLRQLTEEQRNIDREARLIISSELGHSREQITTTYLGR